MLLRNLLKLKIADAQHDLLQKSAYVAVRAARMRNAEAVVEMATERLKAVFPDIDRDKIEEAVLAMNYNLTVERGETP